MSTSKLKSLKSALKGLVRLLVYIPLLFLVVFAILFGTSFGARISVYLANTFVPNLQLTYSSGSLNRNIQLSHAKWSMDGIKVEVKDLHLKWQPTCLFNTQLCVSDLFANKVNVDINTQLLGENTTPPPPTEDEHTDFTVALPFSISLNNADLNNIKVKVNDMQFNALHLNTAANWPSNGLKVDHLSTQGLFVSIPLNSENNTSTDTWPLASLPRVHNPVPVTVNNIKLIDSKLELGKTTEKFEDIQLTGSYINTLIKVNYFSAKQSIGNLSIQGLVNLKQHYPMDLHIHTLLNTVPNYPDIKPQSISLRAKGDLSKLQILGEGDGDTKFNLDAEGNLTTANLPYKIKLSTALLRWPLANPKYVIKNISLDSQGDMHNQKVILSARAKTPFYPKAQIATSFTHKDTQLNITYFNTVSGKTSAYLKGILNYKIGDNKNDTTSINWRGKLISQNINLSDVRLPNDELLPKSNISANLSTKGHWSDTDWHVDLDDMTINGSLKNSPLTVFGDINLNNKLHFKTTGLEANVFGAKLTVSGSAEQEWKLNGQLSIPDIATVVPEASGSLIAHINMIGTQDDPTLELSSSLEEVNYQNIDIKLAQLTGNYQLKGNNALNLSLLNHNINFDKYHLSSASLSANGNLNHQNITFDSEGDININADLKNTLDIVNKAIETRLNTLDIKSIIGHWQLDKPLNLDWNNDKQQGQVSNFCLISNSNSLCSKYPIKLDEKAKKTITAEINFDGSLGNIFHRFFPENVSWQGRAQANAKLDWPYNAKPKIKLLAHMEPGEVTITRQKEIPAVINYQGSELSAKLNEKQLAIAIDVNAGKLAQLDSHINIDVGSEKHIQGNIDIHHIDIHALQAFFPQIATLQGKVSSKLLVSGTLIKPKFEGEIKLKEGAFAASANPTYLNDVNLTLTLMGQNADILGHWKMGKGQANVNGLLSWEQGIPMGNIQFKGNDLAVIAPPLAILSVSPNLNIKFSPKGAQIHGGITIPSGDIKIIQLAEDGVPVSDDLVFKDSISASQAKIIPFPISADLNIQVAKKVTIEGMGLKGNLAGTLTLQQQPLRPPMLFGEIRVLNGHYKFLGQKLKILTGELQFVGPPALPNLNIEAVRVIKDEGVTAGIKVSGTPRKPIVTLFSNPVKEQAEILSYIIKGSGFSNKDQNDALILSAALSLSSQLGNGAIGNIGDTATSLIEKIGISNIQLDANDDGRVAISGYIGDRLMVKYGIGVFNPGYEITVRYYLLSRLYLETISGSIEQSLDIYYSFDL